MAIESETLPRLFLIRHGDTAWTESRRHTGLTDIPLNAVGKTRARQLRKRLEHERFSRVFTSPLIRAQRTCEVAGFGGGATVDADLLEWDYGDYEGLTTAQIHKKHPGWELFRDGVPDGESIDEVAARADRFLQRARLIDGDVAAFSSGHIIRMLAGRWLDLAPRSARGFYTATASVGVLGYEHHRDEAVVLLWNDVDSNP